jgi:manganese transport protein
MSETSARDYRDAPPTPSLPEVHGSVPVLAGIPWWRKMLAFAGPGLMVAVGYMDPGNWATDIAGGSKYEYQLISVILISNWMAILLQALAARLGIVTQRDLAQACRDYYSRPAAVILWLLCEVAIAACDLAEVLGSAIALNLLFGMPLTWGVCITAADVLIILLLQHRGFRLVEALVAALIFTIGVCYAIEIYLARPDWGGIARGFLPTPRLFQDRDMLYIAIGILGATVMPHNLYLHSSIVQTRAIQRTREGLREAIRFNFVDSTVALSFAFFINAAILIMAAAVFFRAGRTEIEEIQNAYQMLGRLLNANAASVLFAVALLCSGQNSTLTGTLAGQIVMEGFMNIRLKPWLRRLITRLIAIVPAVIVTALYGARGTTDLLVLSQVILSLQLSFAVFPLVQFTSDPAKMGHFANPRWLRLLAWTVALTIAALNAWLLFLQFKKWFG